MKVFTLAGLLLNFLGAVVLAVGFIKTPSQIKKESDTYRGQNPHIRKSMYRDRNAAILGISIMALGFALSFFSELWK